MPHQGPVKCQSKRSPPVTAMAVSTGRPAAEGCLTQCAVCLHRLMPRGHLRKCSLRSARWRRPSDLYNLLLVPGVRRWSSSFSPRLFPSHWRSPHTTLIHSRQAFHSLSSRGVHVPRTSPLLSVQRRRRRKHSFGTDEAPHSASPSCSLSFSFSRWPQLTQTTAGPRRNSVQRKIILPAVTESMSRVVFGKKLSDNQKRRGRRKWIRQREPLMLSCTALCFVLYQACKNYNQASTAFCALKSRVEHHFSMTKLKQTMKRTKMHLYVLRLIVQVLVGVWYLTFNKASAFAKQDSPVCDLVFCAHMDRVQRAILQHHLLVNEKKKKRGAKI